MLYPKRWKRKFSPLTCRKFEWPLCIDHGRAVGTAGGRGDVTGVRQSGRALDDIRPLDGNADSASSSSPPGSWLREGARIGFAPGLIPDTFRWTNRSTYQQVLQFGPSGGDE